MGLAAMVRDMSSMMRTCCGTPGFMAPELLQRRHYTSKATARRR